MRRRPLFIQLFYSYIPVIGIGLFILVILINQITKDFYYDHVEKDLHDRAKLTSKIISQNPELISSVQELAKSAGSIANMRVTIIDQDGVVVGDSDQEPGQMDNHKNRPEILEALNEGVGSSQRFSKTLNQEMMYLAIPMEFENNKWTVRVSMSLNNLELILADLQKQVTYLGLIIGLILFLISLFISRQVTIPLQLMRKDAENYVNTLQLADPLPTPKTKELASLSISLNKMAVEMDKKIKIIQQEKDDREELLSSMQDGIISLNKKMEILSINDIAKEYLQIDSDHIVGQKISSVVRQKKVIAFIKKVKKNKGKTQDEIVIKTNKKRTMIINGTPLVKGKKMSGILITINDVTFQKQLERVRQDFVANVSHELKTPITSMLGYIEIIQASKIDQDKKEKFLNKVLNQTNRMNAIIDDLLRLSKIESQEEDSSIELFEMPLAPILEGAAEDVSENSKQSSNRILVHCDDVMVNADAQLLREAIVNLLENAIKYGDNGRDIKITVEDNDQLYIHIENAGEPILPKYREKIFQRFYRIDKSRDRRAGGTGLGLAIVKHISLVHNGEVLVSDSKIGKCRFTIMLPSVVQQKAQNI
tara:strand:- start:3786 stop:5564 length:1779 start_codon:yes stop_codon:yes gene_type:complete